MKELFRSIVTQFTGSTLATEATGGIHLLEAPPGTAMPYVVFSLPSNTSLDRCWDVIRVSLQLFSASSSVSEVADMYAACLQTFEEQDLPSPFGEHLKLERINSNLFRDGSGDNRYWRYVVDFRLWAVRP